MPLFATMYSCARLRLLRDRYRISNLEAIDALLRHSSLQQFQPVADRSRRMGADLGAGCARHQTPHAWRYGVSMSIAACVINSFDAESRSKTTSHSISMAVFTSPPSPR